MLKRLGFIKSIVFQIIDKMIYQKQSQFLLHPWGGHRTPFQAILLYNRFGRIIFAAKEFIALLTKGKLAKKTIMLEGYEKIEQDFRKGDYTHIYPISPMLNNREEPIDELYLEEIEKSLDLAYTMENNIFDKTEEWNRVTDVFKSLFFKDNGKIDADKLGQFRATSKRCEEVFGDQFYYVDQEVGYTKAYLKAIDLVLEYHRYSKVIKKELLASVSESSVGGSASVYYRGQYLSEKLLFHTLIVNDIVSNIDFLKNDRNVIVDIGSGYGGLDRLLSHYIPNACFILVDLPETLLLTSYYMEYNFPNKKIALLSDIADRLDDFDSLVLEYDFIIIPPSVVEKIPSSTVDLVMNSASLGFMQKDYVEYYLSHIYRMLRPLGHFYSLNKEYSDHLGIGFYSWNFKGTYLTKHMEYNNRFSYAQWLGQKVEEHI
jgi:putative sugar O-methyltransferase